MHCRKKNNHHNYIAHCKITFLDKQYYTLYPDSDGSQYILDPSIPSLSPKSIGVYSEAVPSVRLEA